MLNNQEIGFVGVNMVRAGEGPYGMVYQSDGWHQIGDNVINADVAPI